MIAVEPKESMAISPADAKSLVSIVIPCYNEAEAFPYLRVELVKLADALQDRFDVEIILIDDGSKDSTWQEIVGFASQDGRVRGIELSRNFGHQMALPCGCNCARGDAVVSMDADLQDPPEVVHDIAKPVGHCSLLFV